VNNTIKKVAIKLLPEPVLQAAKRMYYAHKLRTMPESAERDLRVVKHLVKRGDSVADVGANFGVYTRFLSELVGPGGRVVSIEPMPPTFDVLSSSVRKLRLANVEALNIAASDAERSVTMEVPLYDSGGEDFYSARITGGASGGKLRHATVRARPLDSIFPDGREISFVKCDVEGHELQCIRGAGKLIERSRPAWLVEIMGDPDNPGSDAAKTFAELCRHGYEAWWFDGRTLRMRQKGERNDNYFFLTCRHVQGLQEQDFPMAGGASGL